MSATFDSRDFIEDAVESLDKSQFQWVLLVVVSSQVVEITSAINPWQWEQAKISLPSKIEDHFTNLINKNK